MHRCARHVWPALVAMMVTGCAPRVIGMPPPPGAWPEPPAAAVVPPSPRVSLDLRQPAALATDPEALRFHLLNRLVEEGLDTPDDAQTRRTANLGALLPFSAPPPAAGLAKPAPLQDVANRLASLAARPGGANSADRSERDFLLESLLPTQATSRAPAARIEPAALTLGQSRIDTLANAGLVSPDERQRELDAIGRGQQALASAPPPPPPPPAPPKKKRPRKKAPAAPAVKPEEAPGPVNGGVPGGVIAPIAKAPMGVHLLSMASDAMTDKAVDALKKEYPELAALTFKAVKTEIPDLGTTYRLLAGPLAAAEAEQLCKSLQAKGQSCAAANFP